jgi:hypothetical protein
MLTYAAASKVLRSRRLLPAAGVLLAGVLLSACLGWSTQYNAGSANIAFDGISCATTSDCVAVANVPGAIPSSASTIETTTNGGSSWSSPAEGTNQILYSVSCPDATHCIAAGADGGDLFVTSNPQGTWTATPTVTGADSVTGVSCANDSDCFAIAIGTFYGGPQSYGLIQTVNGGQSWSLILNGLGAFYSLSCPSTTTCFIAGLNATGNDIVSTTNLDTWHTTQLSGDEPLNDISCATTTSCMVVGYSQVFSTSNGSTWVNDSSSLDADTGSALANVNGVSCIDAADCTVVGNAASGIYGQSVAATNNGGTTWHVEALPSTLDLATVSCASTTACWAGGAKSIVATSNGGVASPQLNSLSPTSGPAGTSVTISGVDLNSTPVSVDFGSVPATSVTVVSASEITAVAPTPTTAGTVDVTVHTSRGTTPYVIGDQFTYTG